MSHVKQTSKVCLRGIGFGEKNEERQLHFQTSRSPLLRLIAGWYNLQCKSLESRKITITVINL